MDRIDPDCGVTIRRRRTGDVSEAAHVLVEVHRTDGYPVEGVEHSEAWLFPLGLRRAWVAETGGRIVGHVAVSESADDEVAALWHIATPAEQRPLATLARLFVLPTARRRAAGERLVQTATAYAHQHGLRLVLDVMVKDTAAIRLYQRLGWQEFGTVVHPVPGRRGVDAACYVAPDPEDGHEVLARGV
jgi:ribosomal protein S18 acetylase RimI-like enzyme